MASKYLTMDEAARKLGITVEELAEKRQKGDVYALRDAQTWKFDPKEVDRYMQERAEANASDRSSGDDDSEVGDDLVSEFVMGASGGSTKSTVIGKPSGEPGSADDSDIKLAADPKGKGSDLGFGSDVRLDSDVKLADDSKLGSDISSLESSLGSDVKLSTSDDDLLPIDLSGSGLGMADDSPTSKPAGKASPPPSGPAKKKYKQPADDELSLAPGDLSLDSEEFSLAPEKGKPSPGDSSISLEEDLVLGGSGSGSDVTRNPGDSGIQLIDPSDSGLSLEGQVALDGKSLSQTVDFDTESASSLELKGDDEFLLTPLEETGEDDSSDSGSQVIALDTEGEFDDATATMLSANVPGLLAPEEEAAAGMPHDPFGGAGVSPMSPSLAPAGQMPMYAPMPQTRFSTGSVVGMALGLVILALTGMMMYDLMRTMWSWDQPTAMNSQLMDTILGLIEKKR